MRNVVIVGGGAGGIELATFLGDKLGRKKQAKVTLVDRNATHLWKPLLHEIATGVMDDGTDSLSYRAHGKNHHFIFSPNIKISKLFEIKLIKPLIILLHINL